MERLLVAVLALLAQGCCIPFPASTTVVPAVDGRATADGKPVAGAEVVVARYVYYPHFNPDMERRQTAEAKPDGSFSFALQEETEWVMPLMMHGVPGYGWQLCISAPGYETALLPLDWEDTPTVTTNIELTPGKSSTCDDRLGKSRLHAVREPPPAGE